MNLNAIVSILDAPNDCDNADHFTCDYGAGSSVETISSATDIAVVNLPASVASVNKLLSSFVSDPLFLSSTNHRCSRASTPIDRVASTHNALLDDVSTQIAQMHDTTHNALFADATHNALLGDAIHYQNANLLIDPSSTGVSNFESNVSLMDNGGPASTAVIREPAYSQTDGAVEKLQNGGVEVDAENYSADIIEVHLENKERLQEESVSVHEDITRPSIHQYLKDSESIHNDMFTPVHPYFNEQKPVDNSNDPVSVKRHEESVYDVNATLTNVLNNEPSSYVRSEELFNVIEVERTPLCASSYSLLANLDYRNQSVDTDRTPTTYLHQSHPIRDSAPTVVVIDDHEVSDDNASHLLNHQDVRQRLELPPSSGVCISSVGSFRL